MSYGNYISGRPSFRLEDLFVKRGNFKSIFPLIHQRCFPFFSARYALAAGIKALGLSPIDKVLLPSYNCGVEIDPFKHFGIKTSFFKIDKTLMVDLDDLRRRIVGEVKAILVTHFLGFPQPIEEIKKICMEKGIFLIEDCAHALLSGDNGKELGSYGDIAIFSLLKTLPVPNGGLLVINNQGLAFEHNSQRPSFFVTIFYASELLKNRTFLNSNNCAGKLTQISYDSFYHSLAMIRMFLAGFRKYLHTSGLYMVRPDSFAFNDDICSWGMSAISRTILKKTDFERIKRIRRANFEYLLQYCLENKREHVLFRELPPGVCPLFFPISLENKEKREQIYRTLKGRGITTHPWWELFHPDVPWEEFPDAVDLKNRLFGLPIHQDLSREHLDIVIKEFEAIH